MWTINRKMHQFIGIDTCNALKHVKSWKKEHDKQCCKLDSLNLIPRPLYERKFMGNRTLIILMSLTGPSSRRRKYFSVEKIAVYVKSFKSELRSLQQLLRNWNCIYYSKCLLFTIRWYLKNTSVNKTLHTLYTLLGYIKFYSRE